MEASMRIDGSIMSNEVDDENVYWCIKGWSYLSAQPYLSLAT